MLRRHPIRVLVGTFVASVLFHFLSYPGGNDMVDGAMVPRNDNALGFISGIFYFVSLGLMLAFIVMAVIVVVRKISGRRTTAVSS